MKNHSYSRSSIATSLFQVTNEFLGGMRGSPRSYCQFLGYNDLYWIAQYHVPEDKIGI
jgi:hypothetical protein